MHFSPTTIPNEIRRDMIYFRSVAVPNDITGGARLICHEIEKEGIGSKCGREEFFLIKYGYLLSYMVYCPTRGMGEKPSPLGQDFSLLLMLSQGFKGSRVKQRLGWSFHLPPRTLGSLDPKPSV